MYLIRAIQHLDLEDISSLLRPVLKPVQLQCFQRNHQSLLEIIRVCQPVFSTPLASVKLSPSPALTDITPCATRLAAPDLSSLEAAEHSLSSIATLKAASLTADTPLTRSRVNPRDAFLAATDLATKEIKKAEARNAIVFPPSKTSFAKHYPPIQTLDLISTSILHLPGQDTMFTGRYCQDAVASRRDEDFLVVALSDGFSSASHSHIGAQMLAHYAVDEASTLVSYHVSQEREQKTPQPLLTPEFLAQLYGAIQDRLIGVSSGHGFPAQALYRDVFAATLLLAIVTRRETLFLSVGDGFLRDIGVLESLERLNVSGKRTPPCIFQPLVFSRQQTDQLASSLKAMKEARQKLNLTVSAEEEDLLLRAAALKSSRMFKVILMRPTTSFLTGAESILATDGLAFAEEAFNKSRHQASSPTAPIGLPVLHLLDDAPVRSVRSLLLLGHMAIDPDYRRLDVSELSRLEALAALLSDPPANVALREQCEDIAASLVPMLASDLDAPELAQLPLAEATCALAQRLSIRRSRNAHEKDVALYIGEVLKDAAQELLFSRIAHKYPQLSRRRNEICPLSDDIALVKISAALT